MRGKPPPPPAWIMQPPPTGRHRWTGLFHPQRLITVKTTGRNPEIYWSVQMILPISMGNSCNYCEQYTRFQPEYKYYSNKTEQSIFRCLLGFCFTTTFSAPPQILAASTVSSANSRNEEMMGDGFLWCYCCRFVLNSKRLLSTSCNKQGQRSSK